MGDVVLGGSRQVAGGFKRLIKELCHRRIVADTARRSTPTVGWRVGGWADLRYGEVGLMEERQAAVYILAGNPFWKDLYFGVLGQEE